MSSSDHSFQMLEHPFPIETPISFKMFTVEGSFQEHAHNFYEIIYISEGKGTLFIHKDSLPFEEGDLFFIPIGMPHLLKAESSPSAVPLQMMNCMFQTELLAPQYEPKNELDREFDAIAQFFRQSEDWLRYQDQGGELARIMYSMNFAVNSQSPGFHYKLYICLLDLLNTLYRLQQFSLLSDLINGLILLLSQLNIFKSIIVIHSKWKSSANGYLSVPAIFNASLKKQPVIRILRCCNKFVYKKVVNC